MFPDPEPFTTERTGDYHDGQDTPEQSGVVPPEAEEYEPPTCETCGAVHDEWDNYCEECGYPVGQYYRLKEEGQLAAYLAKRTPVDPETTPF